MKNFTVIFQDHFKKVFMAESPEQAAAKAVTWSKQPKNGRNGKTIVLEVYETAKG